MLCLQCTGRGQQEALPQRHGNSSPGRLPVFFFPSALSALATWTFSASPLLSLRCAFPMGTTLPTCPPEALPQHTPSSTACNSHCSLTQTDANVRDFAHLMRKNISVLMCLKKKVVSEAEHRFFVCLFICLCISFLMACMFTLSLIHI